jgi:thiamine kinase-like enzyme
MLDGNISKLGYKEGSDFEMREYEKITPFIKKIKNYEKYFNVRATSCEPDVLSTSDLIGFNDVCHNFRKESITASNVNDNLDQLRAINMPDLGMDLKGWMDKMPLDAQRVRQLNDHISELLLHAVVPMNQEGVMHNDLKSENLMMDRADDNLRIIDWGLA